jgi:hypothetical protein
VRQDLVVLGEAVLASLGEHERAVDRHFELTAAARDERRGEAALLLDRRRQPGSVGKIVSSSAVADLDRHDDSRGRRTALTTRASTP